MRRLSAHLFYGSPNLMARFTPDEVVPGFVSSLDQGQLTSDDRVLDTYPQTSVELRPFVCFDIDGDQSSWAPLSRAYRRERVEIKSEWRTGGLNTWRDGACYLNDGANVYIGPHEAFVEASRETETTPSNRSMMSEAGVAAVREEVERQIGRRVREA